MKFFMFAIRKNLQIMRIIIAFIAVYVVNNLSLNKKASNFFLRNNSMLEDVTLLGCGWMFWRKYPKIFTALHDRKSAANTVASPTASVTWGKGVFRYKKNSANLTLSLSAFYKQCVLMMALALHGAITLVLRKVGFKWATATHARFFNIPRSIPLVHGFILSEKNLRDTTF